MAKKPRHAYPKKTKSSEVPAGLMDVSDPEPQLSEADKAELNTIAKAMQRADVNGDGVLSREEQLKALMTSEVRARVLLSDKSEAIHQLSHNMGCHFWSPLVALASPDVKELGDMLGQIPSNMFDVVKSYAQNKDVIAFKDIPKSFSEMSADGQNKEVSLTPKQRAMIAHMKTDPMFKNLPMVEPMGYSDVCDVLDYAVNKPSVPSIKQQCGPRNTMPCK